MSAHFDNRTDCPAVKRATKAFVDTFLAEAMPHLTLAARGCGYALAVHGSRSRDIDIIAVPWTETADTADLLVDRLCGALAGLLGRALKMKDWTDKAHGRRATTILLPGMCPEIDLSVMPRSIKPETEDA